MQPKSVLLEIFLILKSVRSLARPQPVISLLPVLRNGTLTPAIQNWTQ